MTVYITFTSFGSDAGPFNLYSNVDLYASPFAVGVTQAQLLAGYPSSSVPDGTTIIRVVSVGVCTNYVDLSIIPVPPTTSSTSSSSTSTTTLVPTTTTTTTPAGPTTTTTTLPPTTTTTTTNASSIVVLATHSELCFGTGGIRVMTTVPVKVNMTSSFASGASYYVNTGFSSVNIVNQVVSSMTVFNFGIEASNGGTLTQNSSILFTINDFATNSLISSYTFTRNHELSPC